MFSRENITSNLENQMYSSDVCHIQNRPSRFPHEQRGPLVRFQGFLLVASDCDQLNPAPRYRPLPNTGFASFQGSSCWKIMSIQILLQIRPTNAACIFRNLEECRWIHRATWLANLGSLFFAVGTCNDASDHLPWARPPRVIVLSFGSPGSLCRPYRPGLQPLNWDFLLNKSCILTS